MDSALSTVGLPIALAIIMLGLGLGPTVGDFRRVAHPGGGLLAADVLPRRWLGMVISRRPGARSAVREAVH